jgi:subfamily B ATP-binding cassette protein MsbA
MALDARPTYRRLLGYVRPYRWLVVVGVAAALISASAAALYPYLMGKLVVRLIRGLSVDVAGFHLAVGDLSWRLPLLLIAVAIIKALAQLPHTGVMQMAAQRVMGNLRRDLYQKLLSLPPKFFETRHSGELLSRFTSDVGQVEFTVSQALSSYIKDPLQIFAYLSICFWMDRRLFALVFLVFPVAMIPIARFARSVKTAARETQASVGKLTELASEQLHNLPVVLAYGAGPRALRRFDEEQEQYFVAMRRSLFLRGAVSPTLEFLGVLATAAAIGWGAHSVSQDPILGEKIVSFLAAALLMYQPVKGLSATFSMALQGLSAADRLFEIADEPILPERGQGAEPLRRELSFTDVAVSYGDGREALKGVTFTVPAGKRVALVGASGAGKTTLFSTLLGFVSYQRGGIWWDGLPLADLNPQSIRAQIAWVAQEPLLFSGTVRQNLLLGKPDASDAQLWDALRLAHSESFVRQLAGGLDGQVGERGSLLSGGQRQRLAIARAFLRRPSLLLLDEPTSSLDAESEVAVHEGLEELMRGCTTLVIAHRLSTVRSADLIYVLDAGRIVESGSHAYLSTGGGRYAALLRAGEMLAA